MSLINKMKMRSIISRNTGTKASRTSKTGNMSLIWTQMYTDVKCSIEYYELSYADLQQEDSGLSKVNKWVGFYKSDQDILEGDKVTCDKIPNIELLVESVLTITHPIKNKVHHLEVMFSVM